MHGLIENGYFKNNNTSENRYFKDLDHSNIK